MALAAVPAAWISKGGAGLLIGLALTSQLWAPGCMRPPAMGRLRVDVGVAGARVLVDGEEKGQTPLEVDLVAGKHRVEVELEGYGMLTRDLEIVSGQETAVSDQLEDVAPPRVNVAPIGKVIAGNPLKVRAEAEDNDQVSRVEILLDGHLVAQRGAPSLIWTWERVLEGGHVVESRAYDSTGNVGKAQFTLDVPPVEEPLLAKLTPTAAPAATSTHLPLVTTAAVIEEDEVTVREEVVRLLSYPYQSFLEEAWDPKYNMVYRRFNREAYENREEILPQERAFAAVVMENEYLRLVILPELGGRVWRCIFKPTGQELFYRNSTLKPSYWGPLAREENWWLAVGGMEWCLPVREHGYEWGIPWAYEVQDRGDSATVAVWDSTDNRLRARVEITLAAGEARFAIAPRIENPTGSEIDYQFWINAALTLGGRGVAPGTEFIYPVDNMVVHSTGDLDLPGEHEDLSWPLHDDRDLSRYEDWRNWLGAFVEPPLPFFVGAYNHDTQLGVVRTFPPETAQGLKLFAFGPEFCDRDSYTDDDTDYFEIWGGAGPDFWSNAVLGAGESVEWTEHWYPVRDIGAWQQANEFAALRLDRHNEGIELAVGVSRVWMGRVSVLHREEEVWHWEGKLDPAEPLIEWMALSLGDADTLTVRLVGRGESLPIVEGQWILEN